MPSSSSSSPSLSDENESSFDGLVAWWDIDGLVAWWDIDGLVAWWDIDGLVAWWDIDGSSLGGTSMGSSLGWINERMKRKNELELDSSSIANRSSIASFWIQATFN
jgi:hypothetical protein